MNCFFFFNIELQIAVDKIYNHSICNQKPVIKFKNLKITGVVIMVLMSFCGRLGAKSYLFLLTLYISKQNEW